MSQSHVYIRDQFGKVLYGRMVDVPFRVDQPVLIPVTGFIGHGSQWTVGRIVDVHGDVVDVEPEDGEQSVPRQLNINTPRVICGERATISLATGGTEVLTCTAEPLHKSGKHTDTIRKKQWL